MAEVHTYQVRDCEVLRATFTDCPLAKMLVRDAISTYDGLTSVARTMLAGNRHCPNDIYERMRGMADVGGADVLMFLGSRLHRQTAETVMGAAIRAWCAAADATPVYTTVTDSPAGANDDDGD